MINSNIRRSRVTCSISAQPCIIFSEAALMEDNLDVRNASYYTRAVYALGDYILMADRSLGV